MADTLVIDLDSLVCAKDNARPEGKSTKSRARSLWQPLPRPCLREAREERLRLRVRNIDGLAKRITDSLETFSTALQDATNQCKSTDQHASVDFSRFSTKISGRVE